MGPSMEQQDGRMGQRPLRGRHTRGLSGCWKGLVLESWSSQRLVSMVFCAFLAVSVVFCAAAVSKGSWVSAPSFLPSSVTFLEGNHKCRVSHATLHRSLGRKTAARASISLSVFCDLHLQSSIQIKGSGVVPESPNFVLSGFRSSISSDYTLLLDALSLLQWSSLLPWILLWHERHVTKVDLNGPFWVNISTGANVSWSFLDFFCLASVQQAQTTQSFSWRGNRCPLTGRKEE